MPRDSAKGDVRDSLRIPKGKPRGIFEKGHDETVAFRSDSRKGMIGTLLLEYGVIHFQNEEGPPGTWKIHRQIGHVIVPLG